MAPPEVKVLLLCSQLFLKLLFNIPLYFINNTTSCASFYHYMMSENMNTSLINFLLKVVQMEKGGDASKIAGYINVQLVKRTIVQR